MKTELVGRTPVLIIDGQRVVRRAGEIVLEPHLGAGLPTCIRPAELAKHLLRYAKGGSTGEGMFTKHACNPEAKAQLEATATQIDPDEWLSSAAAATMLEISRRTFLSQRRGGRLDDLKYNGGGRGRPLLISKASLEAYIARKAPNSPRRRVPIHGSNSGSICRTI